MFRLVLIGLMLCVVAVLGMFARRIYVENTPPVGAAQFYVGGHRLMIEKSMVRHVDLREGGAVNRLDLILNWPDLSGAAGSLGSVEPRRLIFVTLEDSTLLAKQREDIDPAERPVELYARFLEAEATTGPGGLVVRRFRKATPYDGEDLYLSTPDERQFSARCPLPGAPGAPTGELCLWQTRINGLELHTRFAADHLEEWQKLASGIRAFATRLGKANAPTKK